MTFWIDVGLLFVFIFGLVAGWSLKSRFFKAQMLCRALVERRIDGYSEGVCHDCQSRIVMNDEAAVCIQCGGLNWRLKA
jgi:hypothetical protein